MKNKSILVDCHVFDGGFQGSRTYIEGLYKELVQYKDVTFYLAAQNTENLRNIFGTAPNIHFVSLTFKNKYLRLVYDYPRIIKKLNVEYAHFQYITPLFKSCKFITSTHDVLFIDYPQYFPWFFRVSKTWLYQLSCLRSDYVFTGSKYSKNKINEHYGVNHTVHTAYGIQSVFFEPYDKQEAQQYVFDKYGYQNIITYVSRCEPRKNHLALLKAFVELKLYESYFLVMIGGRDLPYPEYDDYLNGLSENISKKIVTLEKLPFTDMVAFIRASQLSVYPSKAEGFGLPPLESAAARVPTICSNATSMAEFDFFKEDLIDPYDLEDLKVRIFKKINQPDNEHTEQVAQIIKERYRWEVIAKQYYEILFKDE